MKKLKNSLTMQILFVLLVTIQISLIDTIINNIVGINWVAFAMCLIAIPLNQKLIRKYYNHKRDALIFFSIILGGTVCLFVGAFLIKKHLFFYLQPFVVFGYAMSILYFFQYVSHITLVVLKSMIEKNNILKIWFDVFNYYRNKLGVINGIFEILAKSNIYAFIMFLISKFYQFILIMRKV
ncbi:hypothetical protein [Francisella hispaniensis]|uniref:Uncharacterized protein n=1 Tax=Francisella hispaniensis TaxID=622488 RepID=F4BK87_9GAMM|nr:hypothetical protein [Francisella hispaniensis]AEB28581.1 hypothetical protein FN3523_0724 [Francisella hispaniensis]